MPTRVTSGSNTAARDNTATRGLEFYTTQAMSFNLSGIEDVGLAGMDDPRFKGYLHECMKYSGLTNIIAEASPSTRFPKGTSGGEIAPVSLHSTKRAAEFRANYGARRKLSVKESKAPTTQAFSQSSPSKR